MGLVQAQSYNMKFHLTLNPEKNNDIFWKTWKTLIFGYFGPFLGGNRLILKNWTLTVFRFYSYLSSCKNSEKNYQNDKRRDTWKVSTDSTGPFVYGCPKYNIKLFIKDTKYTFLYIPLTKLANFEQLTYLLYYIV